MTEQNNSTGSNDGHTGGASMAPIEDGEASVAGEDSETAIDDQGTDQVAAVEILKQVRDTAFDSSDEKLALALGRPVEEISEWLNEKAPIDSDALIKIRALAAEREVDID
ncbi:MAG TPA: hypothetical protein VI306_15245 [Pyrinomonadaceae bacterium]